MSISRCVLNFKHTSTAAKLNIGHQKPTKAACCRSFILCSSKGEQKEQEQTSPLLPDDSLESRDGQQPGQSFFFCYSGYINRIYDAVRLLLDHPAANREGKRGISLNAVAKYSMIKAKQPNVIVVLKISQCKY